MRAGIVAFVLVLSSSLLEAGTGSVSGQVPLPETPKNKRIAIEKYKGKISGKVAPPPPVLAGVWLTKRGLKAPAQPRRVVLNQKNYQFGKSLLIVPLNTEVSFPNEDSDYHNIFSLSRAKRFDLGRYKKGEQNTPSIVFDRAGFVRLRCEIHEHMEARLLVVDTPYCRLTDKKGNFLLKGVPEGTYTLHAQVDKKQIWKVPVVVKAGRTTKVKLPKK